ncbi:MAG: DUF1232 domain-containing protein [Myxococcota bacterium]|nr:DUF1232 domain-containing protein [Myxococcota bacterium]
MGPRAKLSLSKQVLGYLRDPAVALWRKGAGLMAAIYVISPIDLIPDILPVLGWMDDVGVASAVAAFLIRDIRKHSRRVQQGQPFQDPQPPVDPRK